MQVSSQVYRCSCASIGIGCPPLTPCCCCLGMLCDHLTSHHSHHEWPRARGHALRLSSRRLTHRLRLCATEPLAGASDFWWARSRRSALRGGAAAARSERHDTDTFATHGRPDHA